MIAKYGLLAHYPYDNRSEHVNIGIVVFREDNVVRVHMANNLDKLRAIDPRANLDTTRKWENDLPKIVKGLNIKDAHQFLQNFGLWRVSMELGTFSYENEDIYIYRVKNILLSQVEPAPKLSPTREPPSRLFTDIRKHFYEHGWLGKDINQHVIVPRYNIAPEITAEFAVKNGKLNILETLDLRARSSSTKRNEAMAKTLVLHVAKSKDQNTACYAVLAGMTSTLAKGARDIMTNYADHIYAWESPAEMTELYSIFAKATGKPELDLKH